MSRDEMLLKAIIDGEQLDELVPRTRKEMILKNTLQGGSDADLSAAVDSMAPRTREEALLKELKAGGGGTAPPSTGITVTNTLFENMSTVLGTYGTFDIDYFTAGFDCNMIEYSADGSLENMINRKNSANHITWANLNSNNTEVISLTSSSSYRVAVFPIKAGEYYGVQVPTSSLATGTLTYIFFSGNKPYLHVGAKVYATGTYSTASYANNYIKAPEGATHVAMRITKADYPNELILSRNLPGPRYIPNQECTLMNLSITSATLKVDARCKVKVFDVTQSTDYAIVRPEITSNRLRVCWSTDYPGEGVSRTQYQDFDSDTSGTIFVTSPNYVNYCIIYYHYCNEQLTDADTEQAISISKYKSFLNISANATYKYSFDVCDEAGLAARYLFNTGCMLGENNGKRNYVYKKGSSYYLHKELDFVRMRPYWTRTGSVAVAEPWSDNKGCHIDGTSRCVNIKNNSTLNEAYLAFYDVVTNIETEYALVLPEGVTPASLEYVALCISGNKLYSFGNRNGSVGYVLTIDLDTHEVVRLGDAPLSSDYYTAKNYGDDILLMTSYKLFKYTPATDTWFDYGINTSVAFRTSFEVVDDVLYGLYCGDSSSHTALKISLKAPYTVVKNTITDRRNSSMTLLYDSGWLYAMGGSYSYAYRYKYALDGSITYEQVPDPSNLTFKSTVFKYNGWVYAVGGEYQGYNIQTNRWRLDSITELPEPEESIIDVEIDARLCKHIASTSVNISSYKYRAKIDIID